jgi:ATP-grasp domain
VNVVVLSPHFPPNWFNFSLALRRAGATVLGIGDAAYDSLRPELRGALTEYYRVGDLANDDELVRAMGWFIHRHGRIDRLDSLNEHWLEAEARLRTDFNIEGIRSDSIALIKRKSLMKERFQRAGLVPARGRVCRTAAELREFIAEVGYPVIAKPDVGVGAARTYRLNDAVDVEHYLVDKPSTDYLVEEFIDGTIVTYDGLTDRLGRVVFATSMTLKVTVLDGVNLGRDMTYWIAREIPSDLEKAGLAVARAFDVRERPFHFEFFRLPDGSLRPIEVNMRPPGGPSVDMANWATDSDFYQAWANVIVNGSIETTIDRPWVCMFIGRRDARPYRLSHDEVIRRYGDLFVEHGPITPIFSGAMGDYAYVARGPDLAPLLEASVAIQERES